MDNIIVEKISINDVVIMDTARFNSNNHWENGQPPADYKEVINASHADAWIDIFKEGYIALPIKSRHLYWLKKASELGQQTKHFSKLFADELEDLLEDHKEFNYLFAPDRPYFVRTTSVSLKYGAHGAGPYFDLKSIIESATTSMHGHSPIHKDTSQLTFYLIPWVDINLHKEFRVFVCENRITAISQQLTTLANAVLGALDSDEAREAMAKHWVNLLTSYWKDKIAPHFAHLRNYSMDIALVEGDAVYFIEINCFGKEYAAGSSLFHWLVDEDILYGRHGATIHFRYAM